KYHGKTEDDFKTKAEKAELAAYNAAYAEYSTKRESDSLMYVRYQGMYESMTGLNEKVKASVGVESVKAADLEKYTATNDQEKASLEMATKNLSRNPDLSLDDFLAMIKPGVDHFK